MFRCVDTEIGCDAVPAHMEGRGHRGAMRRVAKNSASSSGNHQGSRGSHPTPQTTTLPNLPERRGGVKVDQYRPKTVVAPPRSQPGTPDNRRQPVRSVAASTFHAKPASYRDAVVNRNSPRETSPTPQAPMVLTRLQAQQKARKKSSKRFRHNPNAEEFTPRSIQSLESFSHHTTGVRTEE